MQSASRGIISGVVVSQASWFTLATWQVSLIGNKKVRPSSMRQSVTQLMKKNAEKDKHALYVTTNLKDLSQCDHMLVYLTSTTWRSGEKSDELSEEIRTAMDEEVPHTLRESDRPWWCVPGVSLARRWC
jgi:hypothetical protein